MTSTYTFRAHWFLPFPVADVAAVLVDLEHYPDWWPNVLAVASLGPDDARVLCRSRLPYRLDVLLHAQTREPPQLRTTISGDLVGTASWTFRPVAGGTDLRYLQEVVATGRLLRLGSRLARPLLVWNHDAMMACCREGLTRRLGGLPGG